MTQLPLAEVTNKASQLRPCCDLIPVMSENQQSNLPSQRRSTNQATTWIGMVFEQQIS